MPFPPSALQGTQHPPPPSSSSLWPSPLTLSSSSRSPSSSSSPYSSSPSSRMPDGLSCSPPHMIDGHSILFQEFDSGAPLPPLLSPAPSLMDVASTGSPSLSAPRPHLSTNGSGGSGSCSALFSSLLSPQACHAKKRCTASASSGKRSRNNDASTSTDSDGVEPSSSPISSARSNPSFSFCPPTYASTWSSSSPTSSSSSSSSSCESMPHDQSASHLQLPVSLSSLSLHSTRSPSPSLTVSPPLPSPGSSRSHNHAPVPASFPCPYTALSAQSGRLFSLLASLPVHEFKSLLCPLLPHLLSTDASLPSLLLLRFTSRSRWQCMEKHLLAACFSYLSLFDLMSVQSVSHHFKLHCRHAPIWTTVCYDARYCPPIRSDRSLTRLCEAMHRQRIPLTRMRLTNTDITPASFASLALLSPTLTYLDLSCMTQVTDCSMLYVSKLSHLTTLLLNSTSISSCSVRYLRCLPMLAHLSVLYTHVDQTALADLAYLPLRSLAMGTSGMRSKGYRLLGSLAGLQRLQLGCLQAHSLYKLAHLTQVEELEFACITKSRKPAAELRARGSEGHDDRSASTSECVLDLSSLGQLTSLTSLNIGMGGDWEHMSMTSASLFQPLTLLPSLTRLQITSCPLLSNVHLQTIAACPSLLSLHLEGSMTCDGLSSLSSLPSLTSLRLTSPHIGDMGLYHVSQLPMLSSLHLSHPHLTARGLGYLTSKPSLRLLHLECTTVDDGCVDELTRMGGLVDLTLVQCALSRLGMQRVQDRRGGVRMAGCSVTVDGEYGDRRADSSSACGMLVER